MGCPKALDGKFAVITGGSRGIGRATALAFADAGADVAVVSRKLAELEAVVEEIRGKGRRGLAVASDVANIEDSKRMVEKVMAEFGRIDILFNNAGANPYHGPVIKIEEWAWDLIMNVNLKGPFFLSQMVAPIMKKQGGGNIINTGAIGGLMVGTNSIYGVSKAALIMLTRYLAREWGQYGIRVNSIAPGFVKTHLSEHVESLWKDPVKAEALAKTFAMGRLGEPKDIARVALFLASAASSHMTGTTLTVDGGQLLGPPPYPDI